MLELAEQRSKDLGMSSTNKFPLAESNQEASLNAMKNQNSRKNSPSPTKKSSVGRSGSSNSLSKNSSTQRITSSIDAKENVDVALEINITTGPNVQVISCIVNVETETKNFDKKKSKFTIID